MNMRKNSLVKDFTENNEMLYELFTDVFWSSEEKDMDELLENYAKNRYNSYPNQIKESWKLLLKSAYNKLIDHPRYNWQLRPAKKEGTACVSDEFEKCCRLWVSASFESTEFKKSELYKIDVIEASCQLASIKLEKICKEMIESFDNNDKSKASFYFTYFNSLIHMIDFVLENHPNLRLEKWLDLAYKMAGNNEELRKNYNKSARYLITLWIDVPNNVLNDYAAKLWSGLLRDYYFHRWEIWFNGKMIDKNQNEIDDDIHKFESQFKNEMKLSRAPTANDIIKVCRDLVDFSDSIDLNNFEWK